MLMNIKEYEELLRKDFMEALIDFSKNELSVEEAEKIADEKLICSWFYDDDSPFTHKGPRWAAWMVAREMKLIHNN